MRPLVRGGIYAGLIGLGGLGVLGVTPARAATGASAPAGGVAVGSANASGIRTSYDFPGFLVVDQFYDVGGPVAQANVNSSGAGTAFASFPYPGDTIVNAPALANVGTGQAFPFTYPLYVVSDGNLTPRAAAQDASGTILLTAESGPRSAVSGARAAGPTAGVISTAGSLQNASVTMAADGTMTSTADSVTRGIDVGVLRIAEVHVHTVSLLHPGDRRPTTASRTEVTGVTVLGQTVGLDQHGIVVPGSAGGPSDTADLAALNQALAACGISVSLAGSDGGSGSAGVQILQQGKLPFHGSPVGVARTLIGNASSSIVGSSASLTPEAGATTPATGSGDGSTGATTPGSADPSATATPATLPDLPADPGSVLTPIAGTPALGRDSTIAAAAQPPTVNLRTTASGAERTAQKAESLAAARRLETLNVHPQLEFFYLAFAVGSGVLVLTSVARRAKGGRSS
jgi:hypothetical protein